MPAVAAVKAAEVATPAPFTAIGPHVLTTVPEQLLPMYMVNVTMPVPGSATAPVSVAVSVTEPP